MATFNLVNGLPSRTNRKTISVEDMKAARLNNQFVLRTGGLTQFPADFTAPGAEDTIVFLEVAIGSGMVLQDRAGNNVSGSLSDVQSDYSPIRFDGGLKITGTINIAKGFYLTK